MSEDVKAGHSVARELWTLQPATAKQAFSILTAGFFNSKLCNSTNIYAGHLSVSTSFYGSLQSEQREVVGCAMGET